MNIGIFLPNWVGDVAMATPALRSLRRRFGESGHLIGVMRPYVGEVLAGTAWLDECLLYDLRASEYELGSRYLIKRLRSRRLDIAVLLTHSLRTGALAWLGGAKRRVGYMRFGRGLFLTDKLYHKKEGGRYVPSPVLDDYLRLAYAVGCEPESARLELATTAVDEWLADAAWRRLGLPREGRVVTFSSGGAFGAAKAWPAPQFAALARRVVTENDCHVLVLCGPGERDIAQQIAHEAGDRRVVSLAREPLCIGLTKACVRRSRLLVTTDSGPRHFAAAFDVPVITLFGPTYIAWSENHFDKAVHLQHAVPCGPCQKRTCPLGHHRCMTELTVERVNRAVADELASHRTSRAA